jgi:hypothetical protein
LKVILFIVAFSFDRLFKVATWVIIILQIQ